MEYFSDYVHAKMYSDIYYCYEVIERNIYKIYYPEKCDNEFLQFVQLYFDFWEYTLETAPNMHVKHNIKPNRCYSSEYDIQNGYPLYVDEFYRYGILKKRVKYYKDRKITKRYVNGKLQSMQELPYNYM